MDTQEFAAPPSDVLNTSRFISFSLGPYKGNIFNGKTDHLCFLAADWPFIPQKQWYKNADYWSLDINSVTRGNQTDSEDLDRVKYVFGYKGYNEIDLHNRQAGLLEPIYQLTKQNREFLEQIQNLKGYNKTDRIGIFESHGGSDGLSDWLIGDSPVPMKVFFKELNTRLNEILGVEKIGLKDRYDCIVINSCNPAESEFSQALVDEIGVPIVYAKGIVGGPWSDHEIIIAEPHKT